MQASEAIKLIIGAKDKILVKKMLMYDAYEMTFKVFKLRDKKENCESCCKRNNIDIANYDYHEFVNPKDSRIPKRLELNNENDITWTEFKGKITNSKTQENNTDYKLVDVRPKEQYNMYKITEYDFVNIPLAELASKTDNTFSSFNKEHDIFIMCRAGNQSTHATKIFLESGFKKVYNLKEGLQGYKKEINDNVPFY
jgi:rhodanese-related sulfurtransferase